jgi:hypothetical protein
MFLVDIITYVHIHMPAWELRSEKKEKKGRGFKAQNKRRRRRVT